MKAPLQETTIWINASKNSLKIKIFDRPSIMKFTVLCSTPNNSDIHL